MAAYRVLLLLLAGSGCATLPTDVPPQCAASCQVVLDIRDKTMKKFERLCLALSYVGARYFDDKNIQREVGEGVRVCNYVYGNRHHG